MIGLFAKSLLQTSAAESYTLTIWGACLTPSGRAYEAPDFLAAAGLLMSCIISHGDLGMRSPSGAVLGIPLSSGGSLTLGDRT